jgi:hypothetical protein
MGRFDSTEYSNAYDYLEMFMPKVFPILLIMKSKSLGRYIEKIGLPGKITK